MRLSGRKVVVVLGVAVVLLVAATWIVRSHGDGGASRSRPTLPSGPPPSTAGEVGEAEPTSTLPAVGYPGDVEVPIDPSGTRRTHNELAARQVAVDYLVTTRQRLVYLTPRHASEVVEAWAAPGVSPGAIADTVGQASALRTNLAADGGQVWWVVAPLAIRVDAYSPDRARISVWLSAIIASGLDPEVSNQATQPMVRYQTDTVELVWDDEAGWSVWSTTSLEGPTPMTAPSLAIATPDVFITAMEGFELIRRHRS